MWQMQLNGREQTILCFYLNFIFLKLVGYRQFVLRTGILNWNVDGIKVVLLEKEEAQRGERNEKVSDF